MPDPKVSVIIPVRDGERFLGEAIESALAQTLPPHEVIVVDDGSTDATAEVARRYPVRLVSQPPSGVSAARNTGVDESSGEFVTFLSHDDILVEHMLERQVAPLLARPEVGYTQCRLLVFLEPGTARPARYTEEHLTEGFVPGCGCGVARRSVLDLVGPFDTKLAVGEDADWTLRANDEGVVVEVVDEPLRRYRIHGHNASHGVGPPVILDVLRTSLARRREPLVSVILGVRDGEAHLREAIESVLAQDYPHVELIVVDDGSTDASGAIARSYGPPVRVVSTPPLGIGAGRNLGIEEARGELIAFIDADDRWPAGRLPAQLAALQREPHPDVVFGRTVQFPGPPAAPEPAPLPGAMLARRRVFNRVGPFATEWAVGDFMDWFLRARELGVTEAMLPDVVLERRVHAGNHTRRNRESYGDYAEIIRASLGRRRQA